MSKNWDTGSNSAHATPHGWENNRNIEYSNGTSLYCRLYIDAANDLWYSVGQDGGWVDQQLTGAAGILGDNVAVGNCSIAIDQATDHVHIAYVDITNNQIKYCHLIIPGIPANPGNWLGFGGPLFIRVDNSVHAKHCVSVCDDGMLNNGNAEAHFVWDEDTGAGATQIIYEFMGGGPNHMPMAALVNLANTPGELHPTIICTIPEGRDLYAFWVAANTQDIECVRCLDAANPALGANWGGPVAGAGGGVDIAITGAVGDAPSPPTTTYWWDGDERVIVGTSLVGVTNLPCTNYWDETAGPAAWIGQVNGANPSFGVPTGVMLANRGNANNWTMYAHDNAGGHEYALVAGTYSFIGAGWDVQATTVPANNSYMSCEWRHLEIISANHSVTIWADAANNLWYGESRVNTSTKPTIRHPTAGVYRNELDLIEFDWTFEDSEPDTQREYYVQIDDDAGFGSPVADPGAPGGDLVLNTWTASATDTWNLEEETLTAETTYYWRAKTRDSEYGTEYDPDSESAYSDAGTFKTTPNPTMNIVSATQQTDKSCAIEFWLNLPVGVGWNDDVEITAYEYDDNGGFGAFTLDATYHNPPLEVPADLVITGGIEYFTIGWDADADVEPPADTYDETNITVRLTLRYTGDAHGLGNVVDTLATVDLDFKSPDTVLLGNPEGDTISAQKPTLNVSASDTNGWEADFSVYSDAGYTLLLETSGYQGVGITSYKMTEDFTRAGTWWWEVTTRDDTPTQNENPAPTQGSFTYTPPPDPIECQDGTFTLEIDPTKLWVGSEFDTLAMGDVNGTVRLEENINAPNRLDFALNNYNGRYVDPTSDFVIQKGDEVKLVKGDKAFYGTIVNLNPVTRLHRELKVYCESFASAAEREPIQIRILATEESGLYFEDYIKIGAQTSGLAPKWFMIVDADGNEIFLESASNKTPVLSGNPIVMNKVSLVELLNEYSSRTGKVWWESSTSPTGRKSTIYLADSSNTSEGTADFTLHVEKEILEENLKFDFDTLINRVIFTDADVVEQDMDSIREYGVFLHKMRAGSSSTVDEERLIEIAQHILKDRSSPRAYGNLPLVGEHDISSNDLVQIYEDGSDDTKSGFSGLYLVAGVDLLIGNETKTILSLSSRWEDPFIRDLLEMLKEATSSGSDAAITVLRPETAECRLELTTDGVDLSAEGIYVAAREGMDRYSDTDTDADYYSTYGID